MKNKWQLMARQLVIALRGSRSQAFVNRKLGFKFNQVSKWETGKKRLTWHEFAALCSVTKVDLAQHVGVILGYHGLICDAKSIVTHLLSHSRLEDVAGEVGYSRSSLSGWQTGRTDPPLEAILALMCLRGVLSRFVDSVVDINKVPLLINEQQKHVSNRSVFSKYPDSIWVISFLELREYADLSEHVPGCIASKLGLSVELETEILQALKDEGSIQFKDGKYQLTTVRTNAGHTNAENFIENESIRRHWMNRALQVATREKYDRRNGASGYRCFAVSRDVGRKIEEEYFQFLNRLKDMIVQPQHREVIRFLNYQILEVFDPQKDLSRFWK